MLRGPICRRSPAVLGTGGLVLLALLGACGGGGGSGDTGGTTLDPGPHEVRVTVSGLDGSGLVLQNNNGDDLSVTADGTRAFATRLANGATYSVRVKNQPQMLSQTCTVSGPTGTVSGAAVTSTSVSCVTPMPLFAYVANTNDAAGSNPAAIGSVSAYKVVADGSLSASKVGNVWQAVSRRPVAVAVDPLAQFAYVARSGDSGATALVAYAIDGSSGSLTLRTGTSEFSSVDYPQAIAFGPGGNHLYVVGNGSGAGAQLAVHNVQPESGGLGAASTVTFGSGYQVGGLVVDPQGRFVVVGLTGAGNRLAVFKRNASDGTLTAWASTVTLATAPSALAIDPGGRWLYVASNGASASDHLVRAFALPADASSEVLSAVSAGSVTAVAGSPVDLAVHPRGTHVYVLRQTDTRVSVFPINVSGGLGTEATEASVGQHRTGLSPAQIRIDERGTYAYVTNTGGNTLSIYSLDRSTGRMNPISQSPIGTDTAPAGLALIAR